MTDALGSVDNRYFGQAIDFEHSVQLEVLREPFGACEEME